MHTIDFSSNHSWSIGTSPDFSGWLEEFASLMSLRKGAGTGRIAIAARANGGKKSNGWNGFEGTSGHFAWNPETREIRCEIPLDAREEWTTRVGTYKALLVAMASMLPTGSLFLHAATVVKDNQAVLLAASSGGGKSTQSRRFPAPWWAPGDEWCIAIPDDRGTYRVQVLPTWSKVTPGVPAAWDTQRSYPLRAICALKQDTVDVAEPLDAPGAAVCISDASRQVLRYVLSSVNDTFRTWFFRRSFEAACTLAQRIPVFLLRASLEGKPWDVLEEALRRP